MSAPLSVRVAELATDIGWMQQARCVGEDPDAFFVEQGKSASDAKAICAGCEVRQQCLDYANRTHQPDGVWGGLTTPERRRTLRRRAIARSKAS